MARKSGSTRRRKSVCSKRNHVMCKSSDISKTCKWVEGKVRRFCRLRNNTRKRRSSR